MDAASEGQVRVTLPIARGRCSSASRHVSEEGMGHFLVPRLAVHPPSPPHFQGNLQRHVLLGASRGGPGWAVKVLQGLSA